MKRCKWCGSKDDELGLLAITGYDWDAAERGDDVALSIQRVMGHECADYTACARRIVDQGTNTEALRRVAADHENLGDLASRARQILQEWSSLYQEQSRWADVEAREEGRGGRIRGGV